MTKQNHHRSNHPIVLSARPIIIAIQLLCCCMQRNTYSICRLGCMRLFQRTLYSRSAYGGRTIAQNPINYNSVLIGKLFEKCNRPKHRNEDKTGVRHRWWGNANVNIAYSTLRFIVIIVHTTHANTNNGGGHCQNIKLCVCVACVRFSLISDKAAATNKKAK